MKEYYQAPDTSAPVYLKYLCTSDLVPLEAMSKDKFKALVLMLHDKRMSSEVLSKFNPMYNTKDDRLVFRFDGVDLGRDCTGRSGAKWLHYHHDNPKEYVYLQGKTTSSCEPLILVEDLFSAIKINHYTGWSTLCCLGTRISDAIISFIGTVATVHAQRGVGDVLQNGNTRVAVAAFDGDSAGRAAERSLINRLGLRGMGYLTVRIPDGLDPKDLSPVELESLFKFLETL